MKANIDFSGLYEIADDDDDFVLSILMVIDKNLKAFPQEMKENYLEGDLYQLGKKAHKLKSSVAYLEHQQLEEILITLEDAENTEEEKLSSTFKVFLSLTDVLLIDIQQKIEELS